MIKFQQSQALTSYFESFWSIVHSVVIYEFSTPLCFRNFQNVKLRLDFVEILYFDQILCEIKQFKNVVFDNIRGSEF